MLKKFKQFTESVDLIKFKEQVSKSMIKKNPKVQQVNQKKEDKDITNIVTNLENNIKTIEKKKVQLQEKIDYITQLLTDPEIISDENKKTDLQKQKLNFETNLKDFNDTIKDFKDKILKLKNDNK